MSSKIAKANVGSILRTRNFSAQAAHASEGHHALAKQSLKQTKLPNGMVIAALENLSPISRVGVFVRAGARFEKPGQIGLTHSLRNAAGLSTQSSTVFGITRNVEYVGGSLIATTNREDIAYVLEGNRDNIGQNLRFLGDTITRPAFKPWELTDFAFRTQIDLERLKQNPQAQLLEAVHRAAFRGGLGNSLFTPSFEIKNHDHNALNTYVADNFLANRMAVIGLGVELEELVAAVEGNFMLNTSSAGQSAPDSKFIAGNVRVDTGANLTYAAVVAEGVGAKNQKEMIALSLVQQLLGTGPRVPYSSGASPLSDVASKATKGPVAVTSLNISYSDTGLFGFAVAATPDDIGTVVKAVVGKWRETVKSVKDTDLQRAKQVLKASTLIAMENQGQLLEEMGSQALNYSKAYTPKEVEAAIDSVTLQDVSAVVGRVLKSKVAVSAVGRSHNVPGADEL
jgi:ubiquinol-cytochrome c reductase core subunit 2